MFTFIARDIIRDDVLKSCLHIFVLRNENKIYIYVSYYIYNNK